jgi:hypothetical protein
MSPIQRPQMQHSHWSSPSPTDKTPSSSLIYSSTHSPPLLRSRPVPLAPSATHSSASLPKLPAPRPQSPTGTVLSPPTAARPLSSLSWRHHFFRLPHHGEKRCVTSALGAGGGRASRGTMVGGGARASRGHGGRWREVLSGNDG